MQRYSEKNSGMKFEVQSVNRISHEKKMGYKMDYEIFSIALLNKETGETGLIPSVKLLSKPRHIQIAELKSCLRMYEEELGNIENSEHGMIIFQNGKGSAMNIKSVEIKLAIAAINKYLRDLILNMNMQEYECNLQL
jgi:hypothetical protein